MIAVTGSHCIMIMRDVVVHVVVVHVDVSFLIGNNFVEGHL